MDFYNPMEKRAATPQASGSPSYTLPSGPSRGKVGNLDFEQIGGVHGTGIDLQGAGRLGMLRSIADTQSEANPADMQNLDALRSYYASQLADLPGNTANNISSFDTQAQRGLKNLLTQHLNSNAGTGRIGSRQFSGDQGNIYSRAASDYTTGLINARNQSLDQANKIQQGMTGAQNQNMLERQFQLDQGNRMSDTIYKLMALDKGTPDVGAQRAAQDKQNTQQMIQSGATLAGLALASDVRLKKEVRAPSTREVLNPFRRVPLSAWKYQDPLRYGSGEHIAPMAQELRENGFGEAVMEMPNGSLIVDYARVAGRMFAALTAITKELDQIRGELRAKRGG